MGNELGITERVIEYWRVIEVTGTLNANTAQELRDFVQDGPSQRTILILEELEAFDSKGLDAVVWAAKRSKAQSHDFRVVTTDKRLIKVFDITKLYLVISVHRSRAEATAKTNCYSGNAPG